MQVGAARLVAAGCGGKARTSMVSSADRRLVEVDTSRERGAPSVARDHLSKPFCAGPRRVEKAADPASALPARHPPLPTRHAERTASRPNHRRELNSPKTAISRGSRRARSLGGRPLMRIEEQLYHLFG